MLRRKMIIVLLMVLLAVSFEPLQSVCSMAMTEAEVAMLDSAQPVESSSQEKRGNALVRVLKAPFKAIGRLFGRGKKDDNKLHRLSEKDVKRFETAKTTRVVDATSPPAGQPGSPDMAPTAHLERGRAFLEQENLNDAITELSIAVSQDPKHAEAHNLLAVAYFRKGLVERARDMFETSLKINKRNVDTLNNFGYFLFSIGEYKEAHSRLKKAEELAPDDVRVLNNLALVQSELGKFDDANKNFVKAGGEIQGRINAANRLELAGRTEEARKHFEWARFVAENQQTRTLGVQSITVNMEIENGRIVYASVKNPRPGFEMYEASAIRIARTRRYPNNKNGSESVVIRITTPAS